MPLMVAGRRCVFALATLVPDAVKRLGPIIEDCSNQAFFFFKQKTAYEIGLGIPAEPLFRSSHLGFLAGQIGRLITISTTPVIAGDSFEMVAVGALRLSLLRLGLAIDSTVDIFTFYVPHRHVYGEQWIKFMKDGVNATPLPTVNTTGYIDHAAFLGTINPDTNKIPKHLFQ